MSQILAWALNKAVDVAGSYAFEKLASAIFKTASNSEQEPTNKDLKAKLDALLTQLNKVNTDIINLSHKVDDEFLGIKVDLVENLVSNIDSRYTMYISALRNIYLMNPDKPSTSNRERLVDLGQRNSRDVYTDLEKIHTYLVGQSGSSLAAKAVAQSLRNQTDVISHFIKIKKLMLYYVSAQAKGLALLAAASADPEVPFQDAANLIANVQKNIKAQDEFFLQLIGPKTNNFVCGILENPTADVHITLRSLLNNQYLKKDWRGLHGRNLPAFWTLRLVQKLEEKSDKTQLYTFRILHRGRRSEQRHGLNGGYGTDILVTEESKHFGSWALAPLAGDMEFLVIFRGDPRSGEQWAKNIRLYLKINEKGEYAGWKEPERYGVNTYLSSMSVPAYDGLECRWRVGMSVTDHGIGPHTLMSDEEGIDVGFEVISLNGKYALSLLLSQKYLQDIDFWEKIFEIQLTETSTGRVLWRSPRPRNSPWMYNKYMWLIMKGDGNLAILTADNDPMWKQSDWWVSETSQPGSYLKLEDSGDLRIISPDGWIRWENGNKIDRRL